MQMTELPVNLGRFPRAIDSDGLFRVGSQSGICPSEIFNALSAEKSRQLRNELRERGFEWQSALTANPGWRLV